MSEDIAVDSYKQLRQLIEERVLLPETSSGSASGPHYCLKEKNILNGRLSTKLHTTVNALITDIIQKSQVSEMLVQPYIDTESEAVVTYNMCYYPPACQIFSITVKRETTVDSRADTYSNDGVVANSINEPHLSRIVAVIRKRALSTPEEQCKELFTLFQKSYFAPAHKLLQGMVFELVQPNRGLWY